MRRLALLMDRISKPRDAADVRARAAVWRRGARSTTRARAWYDAVVRAQVLVPKSRAREVMEGYSDLLEACGHMARRDLAKARCDYARARGLLTATLEPFAPQICSGAERAWGTHTSLRDGWRRACARDVALRGAHSR